MISSVFKIFQSKNEEIKNKIELKVQFLHGLEGDLLKEKQPYLEKRFIQCSTPSMKVSRWNIFYTNSFPRCLFRNLFKISKSGSECLKNCLKIQADAILKDQPGIIFGESWGGAIGLLLLAYGYWKGPIILIAPALIRFLRLAGEFDISTQDVLNKIDENNLGQNILLLHGEKDSTIPYKNSLEILEKVKGIEFISYKDGDHKLNFLIKDNSLTEIICNHYKKFIQNQKRMNE
ncbi:hypothetical protein ABPG72_019709 [Tetrahymena utriculariae]